MIFFMCADKVGTRTNFNNCNAALMLSAPHCNFVYPSRTIISMELHKLNCGRSSKNPIAESKWRELGIAESKWHDLAVPPISLQSSPHKFPILRWLLGNRCHLAKRIVQGRRKTKSSFMNYVCKIINI